MRSSSCRRAGWDASISIRSLSIYDVPDLPCLYMNGLTDDDTKQAFCFNTSRRSLRSCLPMSLEATPSRAWRRSSFAIIFHAILPVRSLLFLPFAVNPFLKCQSTNKQLLVSWCVFSFTSQASLPDAR
jgi:hypothetical protein